MRLCPKCNKVSLDESWICRECGAILEEHEEPSDTAGAVAGDSLPRTPEDRNDLPEHSMSQEGRPPIVLPPPHLGEEQTAIDSPWQCPRCLESVPRNFDVCWSCGSDREGKIVESVCKEAECEDEENLEAAWHAESQLPQLERCQNCQSMAVMKGLRVTCQSGSPECEQQVFFYRRPQAMVFKDPCHGPLIADVCGACGEVRLRVTNPEWLLQNYRELRDSV